jgi:hypothetical protein
MCLLGRGWWGCCLAVVASGSLVTEITQRLAVLDSCELDCGLAPEHRHAEAEQYAEHQDPDHVPEGRCWPDQHEQHQHTADGRLGDRGTVTQ